MVKTFAEDLRAIREEKNISLKSISQQTRLNITILENIENGDFSFQPQAYIRAFLKQYINSLGLDVEETLFDYDLARSGKYKSKRDRTVSTQKTLPEKEPSPEENKPDPDDERIQIEEPPKKKIEDVKPGPVIPTVSSLSPEEKTGGKTTGDKKTDTDKTIPRSISLKQPEEKKKTYTAQGTGKKNFPASLLSSPVVKNIVLILFIILVLLGVYSLINILFFEGSGDKPEIIRQNFDDVVKEQEKKILGKRTPEEIQDSIRRAAAELESAKDSITLRITSLNSGTVFLVTDSVNYDKPVKIEFEKNQVGVFKARRSFYLSSGNTESFKATINNTPIRFDKTSVSKVKITKDGLIK